MDKTHSPATSPSTLVRYPSLTLRQSIIYLLRFFNAVNPNRAILMTDTEIMYLTEFLLLPEKYKYNRFSKLAKKKVCEALKESKGIEIAITSVNPKLYSLVDKGVIKRDDDGVMYIKDYILNAVLAITKAKATETAYTIGVNFDYT